MSSHGRRISRQSAAPIVDGERRPSKFLTGTAIPNSIIRAVLQVTEPVIKDKNTLRRERDEHVSQVAHLNLLSKYLVSS